MHEAALKADEDPDRLSFSHAVRVVRRKLPMFAALSPRAQLALHEAVLNEILEERVVNSRGWWLARGQTQDEQLSAATPRTTANHPDRFHYRHSDRKMNSIGA